MPESIQERINRAAAAGIEEAGVYLYDSSPDVIKALLGNINIREQDIIIIAGRKNLPGEIFEIIAKDKRWAEHYPIRLALAKNPKTPISIAVTISRYLHVFDLVDLSRSPSLIATFRHKVDAILKEKLPTLALGIRRSLAKRASATILSLLVRDKDPEVVSGCLNNPHLNEAHLIGVLRDPKTGPHILRLISDHQKWSTRYPIRLALIRNGLTPLVHCVQILNQIKTRDLREIYLDESVSTGIKPYIYNELLGRGIAVTNHDADSEKRYEIIEQDVDGDGSE